MSDSIVHRNCRAAAWWNLRELLDPNSIHRLAIPPDDRLRGDLLAPRWKVNSSGRLVIEPKADIRKRLTRSTDAGDAVIQAYWPMRGGGALGRAPFFAETPGESRWGPLRPASIGAYG